MKTGQAFFRLCAKVGFDKTTGWLYWKTLLTVIFKNPKAIEAAVNLAAMYMHFCSQSKYIVDLTSGEIKNIEICEQEKQIQIMLQEKEDTKAHKPFVTGAAAN